MSQRKVLKDIIQFGKREFKKKKPLSVEILRAESKTILTRGCSKCGERMKISFNNHHLILNPLVSLDNLR